MRDRNEPHEGRPGEDWSNNFLSGRIGTGPCDDDESCLLELAQRVIDAAGAAQTLALQVARRPKSPRGLRQLLTRRLDTGVLVMDVDNGGHWACVVDHDRDNLQIACSAQLHNRPQRYWERLSARRNRWYNLEIPVDGALDEIAVESFIHIYRTNND